MEHIWSICVMAPAVLSCAAFATGRDGRDMAKSAAWWWPRGVKNVPWPVACHIDISTYHRISHDMIDKNIFINCWYMLDCWRVLKKQICDPIIKKNIVHPTHPQSLERNALAFVAPFALELLTFCCWFCWFSCLSRNHGWWQEVVDNFDELPFGVRQSVVNCMHLSSFVRWPKLSVFRISRPC